MACMHACMHTYMHTCIHAYMHTCIHAYTHTCIHAYMHTCIHAYIHACMHTYIHTVWSPCVSEERLDLGTELDKLEEEWLDVKEASARMPGS